MIICYSIRCRLVFIKYCSSFQKTNFAKSALIGVSKMFLYCTHICRIKGRGGAGRPPHQQPPKDLSHPNKLHTAGKRTHRRVRTTKNTGKTPRPRDPMSNPRETGGTQATPGSPKKLQTPRTQTHHTSLRSG